MDELVRTRFAPSPTGYLHVGGARTALFNYLLARRLGGKFVLRIEDTDQTRNVADADRQLLDDLRWLGLHWDEGPEVGGPFGPYYQSQRLEHYQQQVRRLLDAGRAYYAFDTVEELEAMRAAAQQRKENFRYPRPRRFPSEAQAREARTEGRPVVVRFAMPDRDFVVHDQILGDVRIKAAELDDFVLIKADGWPTYHFAVVVDDEHMRVTHVLRGQEHLMNTPNHLALQEALGFRTPVYAHLPIILNMDGSKMGKREKEKAVRSAVQAALHSDPTRRDRLLTLSGCTDSHAFDAWLAGQTSLDPAGLQRLAGELAIPLPEIQIHDFRASGYLPQVLVNFIALLGWSPGGDREKMTLEQMCELFTLERIGRTNARFDRDKLLSFNTDALAAADPQRKLHALRDYLSVNPPGPLTGLDDQTLLRLIEMNPTARLLRDIEQKTAVLFLPDDQVRYDPETIKKWLLKGDQLGLRVLRELRPRLEALEDWSPTALETAVRTYIEAAGLALAKVAQPLRVAVTGTTVSPAIFDTLSVLGRLRTLARIDRALKYAASHQTP